MKVLLNGESRIQNYIKNVIKNTQTIDTITINKSKHFIISIWNFFINITYK
jgi:hypothetical protein